MKFVMSFVWSLRRRLDDERGFTMVELMVAVGVILTSVLAMAYLSTIAFSDVALARQRQGANGLANQAMEQIRGLPFDSIKQGLSTSDLAGDSAVVNCGTAKCYGPLAETIPTSAHPAGTTITPLVPHVRTITGGPTSYTVKSYLTYYKNDVTQANAFRAIVVVTWIASARRGISTRVENQSILYSGNGCQSTATHPFAAPCQPFFYGTGALSQGHVDVTGTAASLSFEQASLWLTSESSQMQLEQITAVQGTAQSSGISLRLTGGADQINNRVQVSSASDNDPAQPGLEYDSKALAASIVRTLSTVGSQASLVAESTAGDAGTTTSTVMASASNACHSETDSLPCGESTTNQGLNAPTVPGKTMGIALDVIAGQQDLGKAVLVSIGPPSVQSAVWTDNDRTPGAGHCAFTSGDGCVQSAGTRALGQVTLGTLPANLPVGSAPLAWQGYLVRITNFADSVSAEVGVGTKAPTVTSSGTVSYWNGVGYSTLNIAVGGPVAITVAPVSIMIVIPDGLLRVDLSVSGIRTGGTSIVDPAACGSACTRTSASAISGSPLTGEVFLSISLDGTSLANVTTRIDLGTLTAKGEYKAAPAG